MREDVTAGLDERDVGDQQPDQALALAQRRGGVVEERGQVGGERADPLLLIVGERPVAGLVGAVVVVLGVGELAQPVVPVGLERVGDEPVAGVDGEVAAAGQVGVVAGALDVRGAQGIGFVGAALELCLLYTSPSPRDS